MKKCENCGLPDDATESKGVEQKIVRRAANKFHRDSHVTIWCCSEKCALQSRARAKYGESSHKWPISLAKFAGSEKAVATRQAKAKNL